MQGLKKVPSGPEMLIGFGSDSTFLKHLNIGVEDMMSFQPQ